MAQTSKVSGIVQIDGTPAQRTVRAFGYEARAHTIDGEEVNLSRSLGQATSDGATGEYTIDLLAGYARQVFVVAFDDYGADFSPELSMAVGDRVHPSTPNGYVWECAGAGTLPSEEPAWVIDTETAQLYGTASMIARPFYRPMVHGPVAPEVSLIVGGDPHWDKVVSMLHFDGDLTDEKGRVWTANGSAIASETGGKFDGQLSLGGGFITTPYTADFNWFASDYTIECWINPTNLASFERAGNCTFLGRLEPSGGAADWSFGPYQDGIVRFRYWNGSKSIAAIGQSIAEGVWSHIAAVVSQGEIQVFVNGVGGEPVAITGTPAATSGVNIVVGRYGGSAIGLADDLRITKGVARYTEDFTPPTEPFPNQGADNEEPAPE